MAFQNRTLTKKVGKGECAWCGWRAGRRFACHIIDEGPEREWNAISLCPNCSTVFDEKVRPMLWRALTEWQRLPGVKGLPDSWRKDNKLTRSAE